MADGNTGKGTIQAYDAVAAVALVLLASCTGAWLVLHSRISVVLLPALLAAFLLSLLTGRHAGRARQALAALQLETERRIAAEEALREAHRLEAIGRLTGGVAHDFNNHLTVISSNVELLKRRLPHDAASLQRLADAAMEGVSRAASLTQRLLTLSRPQPADPEPLDVNAVVGGMLDLLRRTLGESVTVRTGLASRLWLSFTDATRLESALLALAVNAQAAMQGGGVLTIRTDNVSLDAGEGDATAREYVMIAVSDTGIDALPEDAGCDPPTAGRTAPGAGGSLRPVHDFARASGGYLRIDPLSAAGHTVRLYLPRYVPHPPAPVPATQPNTGAGETVLVVEDDETLRHTAADALREIGYQVLEAPDAMEAVRLLADRGGIDLLFTDIGLPGGVNGRALADAAQNVHPGLKVLFTTGYRDRPELSAGEPRLLAKPFSLEQLEAKVREVLGAPLAQRAPASTESA